MLLAPQDRSGLLGLPVHKDLQEHRELKDHRGLLERQVRQGHRERRVLQVRKEHRGRPVLGEPRGFRAHRVPLARQGPQGLRRVLLVSLGLLVHKELRVHKVRKEIKVSLG